MTKKIGLTIRVSREDRDRWQQQAAQAGSNLPKWIVNQCNRAANGGDGADHLPNESAPTLVNLPPAPPDVVSRTVQLSPAESMRAELARRGMCIHGVKRGNQCSRCNGKAQVVEA